VHEVYEEIFSDRHPANFYLCGWKNMVDEALQRISALGYERRQEHTEIYGATDLPAALLH
jgi:ferredoxin-NADP reductase